MDDIPNKQDNTIGRPIDPSMFSLNVDGGKAKRNTLCEFLLITRTVAKGLRAANFSYLFIKEKHALPDAL